MKKFTLVSAVAVFIIVYQAQAGVLMQGFYWDCPLDNDEAWAGFIEQKVMEQKVTGEVYLFDPNIPWPVFCHANSSKFKKMGAVTGVCLSWQEFLLSPRAIAKDALSRSYIQFIKKEMDNGRTTEDAFKTLIDTVSSELEAKGKLSNKENLELKIKNRINGVVTGFGTPNTEISWKEFAKALEGRPAIANTWEEWIADCGEILKSKGFSTTRSLTWSEFLGKNIQILTKHSIAARNDTGWSEFLSSNSEMLVNESYLFPKGASWWSFLKSKASELKGVGFTAIWLPPSQKCMNGGSSMGYDPYDYYDLGQYNQCGSTSTRFGTSSELKSCIQTYRGQGMDVYADIVINHCSGGASEYNPNTGSNTWTNYKGILSGSFKRDYTNFHPCQGEQGWCNNDEGIFAGFADLCHHVVYVRDEIVKWGNWLKSDTGYCGWRFDYVKGYGGWVIKDFLSRTGNLFGVGEYWDGNANTLKWWISTTGYQCNAFDFALYYVLKNMCLGGGGFDMRQLSYAGLVGSDSSKAVTFAANHDLDEIYTRKEMAYAYILTAEGYPCVFWKDYYNYNLKGIIDPLVWIHENLASGSTSVLYTDDDLYIAQRNGTPGLVVVINDHASESKAKWVQTKFKSQTLKDYTGHGADKTTDSSGWVELSAPPNSYTVYSTK